MKSLAVVFAIPLIAQGTNMIQETCICSGCVYFRVYKQQMFHDVCFIWNDIAYYVSRGALFTFLLIFILQKSLIMENINNRNTLS